jgi:hypothetical protein
VVLAGFLPHPLAAQKLAGHGSLVGGIRYWILLSNPGFDLHPFPIFVEYLGIPASKKSGCTIRFENSHIGKA